LAAIDANCEEDVMDETAHDGDRKLKIAFVLDKFLPSRGGERYFLFLMDELLKRGHQVHVCAAKLEGTDGRIAYHKIPVWKHPRSLRMLTFLRNSRLLVANHKFDVIHGTGGCFALNVLNPHGGVEKAYLKQEFASIDNRLYFAARWLKRHLSLYHYLELWIQKRLYTGTSVKKVIAVSRMVKQQIITHFNLSEERIALVFNSVDLTRFTPANRARYRAAKRAELGIDDKDIVLFILGNNYRLKGLKPLIRSVALLKRQFPDQRIKLLVAGRGQIARYRWLARWLGVLDSVLFLGSISNSEQYYAAADIYVHPTFFDVCSLVVLEALASGLPVITTKFNGASEAIESDLAGAVLEDPGDVQALARAISRFLSHEAREKAIPVARTMIEKYPLERNIADTLEVYYQIVGP
jgi:UDP-glucose:(heptosyl)LPS alpha-1,3-glucosyltransferase